MHPERGPEAGVVNHALSARGQVDRSVGSEEKDGDDRRDDVEVAEQDADLRHEEGREGGHAWFAGHAAAAAEHPGQDAVARERLHGSGRRHE